MWRKVLCVSTFVSAVVVGLACGNSNVLDPLGQGAKGEDGPLAYKQSEFPNLRSLDWALHQDQKDLSCSSPVTGTFRPGTRENQFVHQTAHSYSFAAKAGVSYQLWFEGSHTPSNGIIAGVYRAPQGQDDLGKRLAYRGYENGNTIEGLAFKVEESTKVIIAVFSDDIVAAGNYTLRVVCSSTGTTEGVQWGGECSRGRQCSRSLSCLYTTMRPGAPGVCAKTAFVNDILANPGMYNGKPVFISHARVHVNVSCNKVACQDDTCCNDCRSTLHLYESLLGEEVYQEATSLALKDSEGLDAYRCDGKECGENSYDRSCNPFVNISTDLELQKSLLYYVAGFVNAYEVQDAPIAKSSIQVVDMALLQRHYN